MEQTISASRRSTLVRNIFLRQHRKWLEILLASVTGWGIWQMPPPAPLDEHGMHFLATLAAAFILWTFEVFEEYIVALVLLLSWLTLDIVPSEIALSGFSTTSWVFVLGAFGLAAAVSKCGLLYHIAVQCLRRIRPDYRCYTVALAASGIFVTPLLPSTKARMGIVAPLTKAISEIIGLKARSNASAGLSLAAYMGFSQMNFLFLTGASTCLVGWNLLPQSAQSEFGWASWTLAALPAAVFTFLFLLAAIHLLFRTRAQDLAWSSGKTIDAQVESLGPLNGSQWLSLAVVALALAGWLGKPFHGIGQAWVALGALVVFLVAGLLDKKSLKNDIDWGFLLFFGVIFSTAAIASHLKVDQWLAGLVGPVLSVFSFHHVPFLMSVLLITYTVRFFLLKIPAVIVLTLVLNPWAQNMGIHPGVLLLTLLMGVETWFLPHQQPSYQIAYASTAGEAFSHAQGRKLMGVKFVTSFLVLAISVPYWTWLGYIEPIPKTHAAAGERQDRNRAEPSVSTTTNTGTHMTIASSRPVVKKLQRLLLRRGYNPGPIDGLLGRRTQSAIRDYQRAAGLTANGKLSQTLLAHLEGQ